MVVRFDHRPIFVHSRVYGFGPLGGGRKDPESPYGLCGCRIAYGIIGRCPPPPPPGPHPPGFGWDQGPPPAYFWVEKFKKIGIRAIGDGSGSL